MHWPDVIPPIQWVQSALWCNSKSGWRQTGAGGPARHCCMPLNTVGSQKAQIQAYVSGKRGVSRISPQRCWHIPWLWMFGMFVLRPGCASVSGAFQPSRSHMGDLCWRERYRREGEGDGKVGRKRRNYVRSRNLQSTISHSFLHLFCHLCYLATFQIDCTRLLLLSALSPRSHWTDDKCRLGLIGSKLKIQAHYLENIQVVSCKPLTAMSFKSEGPCESCE